MLGPYRTPVSVPEPPPACDGGCIHAREVTRASSALSWAALVLVAAACAAFVTFTRALARIERASAPADPSHLAGGGAALPRATTSAEPATARVSLLAALGPPTGDPDELRRRALRVAAADLGHGYEERPVDVASLELRDRRVRILPRYRDGGSIGLRVDGVHARSPWAALGFRDGDTIMALNGGSVVSSAAWRDGYLNAKRARLAVFEVERDERRLVLVASGRAARRAGR